MRSSGSAGQRAVHVQRRPTRSPTKGGSCVRERGARRRRVDDPVRTVARAAIPTPHVFKAIDRPSRILLSTTETRLDGTTLRFDTEFTFEGADGGTQMTIIQRGIPTAVLRADHGRGVANAFDRLEQHIRGR
jgi:uncharacterized protein YndB with AHSA1/START domain